jgi:hypothetical protein
LTPGHPAPIGAVEMGRACLSLSFQFNNPHNKIEKVIGKNARAFPKNSDISEMNIHHGDLIRKVSFFLFAVM